MGGGWKAPHDVRGQPEPPPPSSGQQEVGQVAWRLPPRLQGSGWGIRLGEGAAKGGDPRGEMEVQPGQGRCLKIFLHPGQLKGCVFAGTG